MITGRLIHPPLLAALAAAGHGAGVLICDAHYPATTGVGPNAQRIHLNLAPGLLDTSTILDVLLDVVDVESASVMLPPGGEEPEAVGQHRSRLGSVPVDGLGRFEFYDAARSPDLALVVVSGDTRTYANVLLTLGVLTAPATT